MGTSWTEPAPLQLICTYVKASPFPSLPSGPDMRSVSGDRYRDQIIAHACRVANLFWSEAVDRRLAKDCPQDCSRSEDLYVITQKELPHVPNEHDDSLHILGLSLGFSETLSRKFIELDRVKTSDRCGYQRVKKWYNQCPNVETGPKEWNGT